MQQHDETGTKGAGAKGPDVGTALGGRIYWAPAGSPLPSVGDLGEWTSLGLVTDGFRALGDAAAATGEAVREFARAFEPVTFTFDVTISPDLHRTLFAIRRPKRARKQFIRHHRNVKKNWRRHQRAAQRKAIGIKKETT